MVEKDKKKKKGKELLQIDQKTKMDKVIKFAYKEIAKKETSILMVQRRPILLKVPFTINIHIITQKRSRIDLSNIVRNILGLLLSSNI